MAGPDPAIQSLAGRPGWPARGPPMRDGKMSCPLFFSAPASAVPNGTGLPHDHGHTLLRHCGGTVMTMRIPERMPPLPDVPGSSEAPHQLVVPGPGASVEEVRTFVRALPGGTLESYSRTGLTTASNL